MMMAKTTRSTAPEFLADLLDFNKQVLMENGFAEEKATEIARQVSKKMCERWGGQLIYFPYWLREEISERDRNIYAEFNGKNHAALSLKYKLSVQAIYRIVELMRREEVAERQKTLEI
jgi:Mor family transcriptional regulator